MPSSRRVQFNGDDVAYIRFLENKVLKLEGILQSASRQRGHPWNSQFIINQESSRGDASGPNKVSNQPTKLQFIEFVPPRERTPKSPNDTQIRRQSGLDILLGKIPSFSKWTSNEYDLSHRNINVLKGLVVNDKPPYGSKNTSQPIDIISILLRFSNLTLHAGLEKAFLAKLARFQEFIFMSLCAVALKLELGDDAASIYGVMQSFIGSDAHEKHLLKLIRGVTWASQLISALSTTAWAPGCSYVLFLDAQTSDFYSRCAEDWTSQEYFLDGMNRKLDRSPGEEQTFQTTSLCVPLIIEQLLGNSVLLSDICRCLGHRLLYAESCRPLFEQAFSTSGTKRPAERSLSELSNKRHQPLMLHPDRKGMNRGDELGLHQSEDSPITSLPTAATMTGVNNNLMLGAPNSLPTHNPLESSAVCNAELDIAQDMGINTSVQQDSTNFAVNVGQTHQVSGNDINQVQLNHTQNVMNSTSTISSDTPVMPPATFDPDPFLQGYFDYFDAQQYVLRPSDIMPFDTETCVQLNQPLTNFDSSSA